jgi:DNA repair exonuclease SbcCD nuclease subunit
MFSPSNLSRPILHPDAGQKPAFPPPPPTIHDLDAAVSDQGNVSNRRDREYLEQVQHHAGYDKWVVFTDLHCSPSSLDTCLTVLTRVHELAVERNAGVLFLGDFWHHRGTIRVDCLNAVLENLRGWEVPMVMIPGNHDQVSLDGHSHGLTPFENAYRVGSVPGPLIFSYPTKFRDALFVPHVRNIATMESILQSSIAQETSAIFVHAEVTGAFMNDLIVSEDGIPPASFPNDKRIYSGHFHKPHTVKASNGCVQIEYLGSPYETSLSEAQQHKTLAVLDASWECTEYIPIDIGRRHFKVSSLGELAGLRLGEDKSNAGVRSGDRIVATIPQEMMESQESDDLDHIKKLRSEGVMVEIREIKKSADQAMGSNIVGDANRLEDMSPESTWRAYLAEEELERRTLTSESSKLLLEAGLEILREIEASEEGKAEQEKKYTNMSLTRVSIEGFGPFREKITYPLSNRGLVLLKGTNNDGGSDR